VIRFLHGGGVLSKDGFGESILSNRLATAAHPSTKAGTPSLKIARTMFESALILNYLDGHPELVRDFIDYQWVIQKKHNDYRLTLPRQGATRCAGEDR
jgi:hypothetical protein